MKELEVVSCKDVVSCYCHANLIEVTLNLNEVVPLSSCSHVGQT